jgi:DNA-binding beta-propeller fold protein YncE
MPANTANGGKEIAAAPARTLHAAFCRRLPMMRQRLLIGIATVLFAATATAQASERILLSANDGIETFENGSYTMTPGAEGGSLTALSLDTLPPRILWQVPADQTAAGPPHGLAVTPDGTLAILTNPATLDPKDGHKRLNGKYLQLFDLTQSPPLVFRKVALDHHPWGMAIAPDGRHGLVADGDGTVTWLKIDGQAVTVLGVVPLGPPNLRTMSTAFTHDGKWALVTRRGDATVTALRIDGDTITPARDITVGSNPYDVVVSPNGQWAAVSDIGHNTGDRASITMIDLRQAPFRSVDVFSVGATPEGIAFSPDSKWLAVNSINGSNLKINSPFYRTHSLIQLFDLAGSQVRQIGSAETSSNAQGLAFTPDGKGLLVQDFAQNRIQVFTPSASGLVPTNLSVTLNAAPSALTIYNTGGVKTSAAVKATGSP